MVQNRLKMLRELVSSSQKEFYDEIIVNKLKLDITLRTFQNWENPNSKIKSAPAIVLADYFGVPVTYLLGHSDNPDGVREGVHNLTELDELLNKYREELNEPMDLELYNEIISQKNVSYGRIAFSLISSKVISKIEKRIFKEAVEDFEKANSKLKNSKDWYFAVNSYAFGEIERFYSAIGQLPPDETSLIVNFSTLEKEDRKAILSAVKSLSEKTCYIIDHDKN